MRKTPQTKEYFREYRKKHILKLRANDQKYRDKEEKRKAKIEYMKSYIKRPIYKIVSKRAHAKYKAKFKDWWKYKDALESGKLQRKPCEVCGELKVDGHHHWGYVGENALRVMWLCRKHHMELHRKGIR